MAYIHNFDYDIFISYSHIDNEKTLGQNIGWIEQFYKDLSVTLWKSIGTRDIRIWWDDKRLDGGVLFDEAIAEGIKKSAILICLNSPAYLRSKYCKKELELFTEHASNDSVGIKVGNNSRIFNVLLYNIPFINWPPEFSGRTGFPFHDSVDDETRGHPIDLDSKEFRDQLENLTDSLVKLIEEFPGLDPIDPEGEEFSIFFGDVSDSLGRVRRRTITELEKKGYKIISNVPPPYGYEEHEEVVKEKVEKSKLVVHLLDQNAGEEIEGKETCWFPQRQAEITLLSDTSQLIWVPANLSTTLIKEEQLKNFVESVEKGTVKKEIEFIRGTESDLPKQIMEIAEQIKLKIRRKSSKTRISILLDTHYNDQLYALELSKNLLENDIQPFINPQDDDPLKNISLLEERISQVNNLVFFYGKVKGEWVSERMKAARNFIVTNDYPIEEFFVYMLPPHKDPNDKSLKQKFIKVNVVDNSDKEVLDMITVHQFLKNIKDSV